ncbi:MAG: hypothetical protein JWM68_3228 [Verrucomicrobiales bacterium]|nr:hypothetical protein [Verrucomicrobiales bacterium]
MTKRYMGISILSAIFIAGVIGASGAELATVGSEKFLGAPSCSSTSCHGGAGEKNNQNLIWSKLDFHSRSYATLTSARSERFAEVLKLGDATKSARCTTCHAPFQTVEEKHRLAAAKPVQGVSCETCHAPAENWLRSHTRPDFTHSDRVASGMRDLKSLYVRANTCVACHQTLDTEISAAGHPDLLFELDGQSVSEPKHWRDADQTTGPQSWLIGQAVALRELSWQLSREQKRDENLVARWSALVWLLQQVGELDSGFPTLKSVSFKAETADFESAQKASDALARRVAETTWTDTMTRTCLTRLSQTAAAFQDPKTATKIHARRAERLVLGLDRLIIRLEDKQAKELDPAVRSLFKSVQSIPDFQPEAFAKEITQLADKLRL